MKGASYLANIEHTRLDPANEDLPLDLIDRALDQAERQRAHHQQLDLVFGQLGLGRDLVEAELFVRRWSRERHLHETQQANLLSQLHLRSFQVGLEIYIQTNEKFRVK